MIAGSVYATTISTPRIGIVMSEELNLVWYSLERSFQELQTKQDLIEDSIETLQEYRKSVSRDMQLLKSNLDTLMRLYGAVDAERNLKEQPQQEV